MKPLKPENTEEKSGLLLGEEDLATVFAKSKVDDDDGTDADTDGVDDDGTDGDGTDGDGTDGDGTDGDAGGGKKEV
ncbi:MAG TPA: hypothetical protein VKV15_04060 [Bryobacteraceae bacterium]|nr:hypothetical protein [Bryobacteraceae bacterium]